MGRHLHLSVLFALNREARPFMRRLVPTVAFDHAPCPAQMFEGNGRSILVLETGVGAERARSAIEWVLDEFSPRLIVSAGFAGALDPALKVGDVVVASQVVEDEDTVWRVSLPAELGEYECGKIVTSDRLVGEPADKRKIAERYGAIAVDMESAAIAEACQVRRVSCACVRAISDAAEHRLSPELVALLEVGQVSLRRVFGAILRKPSLVPELIRLQRATSLAAENLARALARLLGERGA